MANVQVTLIWRCKTEKGWRIFQALFGGNGRPRKGWVKVGNPPQECHYPEGLFQLRYYEGDKVVYRSVGPDANKALDAMRVQENLLKTRVTAAEAGVQIVEDPQRKLLAKEYKAFLQAAEDRGAPEAKDVYRLAVDEFFLVVRKTYVDELTADDLLRYQRQLRVQGKADRTIYNRWNNVKAFYLWCGLDPKSMKIVSPKYEEQTPEIYEPGEMRKFFKTIERDPSLYAACAIMRQCGLRDQEVRYLEWPQVNLERGVLRVQGSPRYGFKVKDCEQRIVRIPKELAAWLTEYNAAHPNGRLVAPTATGKPNTKHLLLVKRAARRAGLNCNACEGCERNEECSHWFLHKFRATCITMWLRSGMDLRTAMKFSGHADLASVMRYLSPADDESVRDLVDGIGWGD
jgi:integrase